MTVLKNVDGVATEGWTISATHGALPASGDTDAEGTIRFDWDSVSAVETTISEDTSDDGFTFVSASCDNDGVITNGADGAVNLTVGPEDIITCVFNNAAVVVPPVVVPPVVVPPVVVPPVVVPPVVVPAVVAPLEVLGVAVVAPAELPRTGSSTNYLLQLAAIALLAGLATLLLGKSRRRSVA